MINIKKLINIICISGFILGSSNLVIKIEALASNNDVTIYNQVNVDTKDSQDNQSRLNADNFKEDNNLNADDFKRGDSLPEKNYDSENWADDLYTADDLLGGSDVTSVTMGQFEDRVLNKMLEVVSLFQTISKPLCILIFILCALGLLTSIVFNTNKHKMFILGLILTVIAYVGIIFAPDLVLFFVNWLSF